MNFPPWTEIRKWRRPCFTAVLWPLAGKDHPARGRSLASFTLDNIQFFDRQRWRPCKKLGHTLHGPRASPRPLLRSYLHTGLSKFVGKTGHEDRWGKPTVLDPAEALGAVRRSGRDKAQTCLKDLAGHGHVDHAAGAKYSGRVSEDLWNIPYYREDPGNHWKKGKSRLNSILHHPLC